MTEQDIIRLYFKQINQTPLLSKEREVWLATLVREGDEDAREALITANLRLVVSQAKKLRRNGANLLDLIQAGNLGLIRATKTFDPTRGNRFSTYATWWIRQSISRHLLNESKTIRLPVHIQDDINEVKKMQAMLERETGERVSHEQIAERLDITAQRVAELLFYDLPMVSLSEDFTEFDDDDTTLADLLIDRTQIPVEEEAISMAMSETVRKIMMEELSDQERKIIEHRYGFNDDTPKSMRSTAKLLGLPPKKVQELEKLALQKIKDQLGE